MKVVHDGEKTADELCCFCWKRTNYWFAPKDVAVCPECARTRKAEEVPTKAVWWKESEIHLKPHLTFGGSYQHR